VILGAVAEADVTVGSPGCARILISSPGRLICGGGKFAARESDPGATDLPSVSRAAGKWLFSGAKTEMERWENGKG